MRASGSAEHSSNQSRPQSTTFAFCCPNATHQASIKTCTYCIWPVQAQNHQAHIFNTNNANARICTLAFRRLHARFLALKCQMSNSVFFTCSSNLLMMAWTHSTGLCAAMLRRMRAPLCLLSITFAIPIPAPESSRVHQIPPKQLRKIIKEENGEGGGGRRGVWFSFSLQAYSTTPP